MYGLTFHAGTRGKIKLNSAKQEMKHACRDLDPNYANIKRANKNIDSKRTKYNQTYAMNAKGNWYKPSSLKQLENNVEQRFAEVKGQQNPDGSYRKVRSDAVCIREVVMQIGNMDNDYYAKYAGHPEKIADDPSFKDMMDYAVKKFGKDHIGYFSIHVDEGLGDDSSVKGYHPHVHLGILTQYQDEKTGVWHFNQKKALPFTKNKQTLREAHKDFYSYMQSKGYDVGVPMYTPPRTVQKAVDQKTYNRARGLEQQVDILEKWKFELDDRDKALTDKEQALDKKSQEAEDAKRDAEQAEERADTKWDKAHARNRQAVHAINDADEAKRNFDDATKQVEQMSAEYARRINELAQLTQSLHRTLSSIQDVCERGKTNLAYVFRAGHQYFRNWFTRTYGAKYGSGYNLEMFREWQKSPENREYSKMFDTYEKIDQGHTRDELVRAKKMIDTDHDGIDDRKQAHHVESDLPDLSAEVDRINRLHDYENGKGRSL